MLVEHVMSAVRALCGRVVVMNAGRQIAAGDTETCCAIPKSRMPIWDTGMLEVSTVSQSYGQHEALIGVSMHVSEGEIVAILGANGAGKTRLLKTITGLTRRKARSCSRERDISPNRQTASWNSALRSCRKAAGCSAI